MEQNNVYIGWDSREQLSYQVAKYSCERRTSDDVVITPIKKNDLQNELGLVFEDRKASTEFTLTRFFVPYMNDYKGWALFVDCDVLFLDDVQKLFDVGDDKYAVMVVKHESEIFENRLKKAGVVQEVYPRKNWSSVVLWNCSHPSHEGLKHLLTKMDEDEQIASKLHRFSWLKDEEIGELSKDWNYLAGYYDFDVGNSMPNIIHYTDGVPAIEKYRFQQWASVWKQELIGMYSDDILPRN